MFWMTYSLPLKSTWLQARSAIESGGSLARSGPLRKVFLDEAFLAGGCTRSRLVLMVLSGKITATHLILAPSPSMQRQLTDHRSLNVLRIIHASLK